MDLQGAIPISTDVPGAYCPYCGQFIPVPKGGCEISVPKMIEERGCQGCRCEKYFPEGVPFLFIKFWEEFGGWPVAWDEARREKERKRYRRGMH